MINYTHEIQKWAIERGLHNADPHKQFVKLIEEVGELAQGLAKGNAEKIIDGIGDTYVVLTILAQQMELDIESCIMYAYNEIKDRKGKLVNGVFIKEEDLNE